jgi:tight adherence protein B
MRLKVKALSAEARFSAMILSILPIALFALLSVIAPNYYGQVWHVAFVKPLLVAGAVWMMLGNIIMYRMVRFEI